MLKLKMDQAALVFAFAVQACWAKTSNPVFHYEPEKVELSGSLVAKRYPEAKNVPVLILDNPIDLAAGGSPDFLHPAERGQDELQLVFSYSDIGAAKELNNHRVIVRGSLFHSHTAHHQTKVLLTVASIAADNVLRFDGKPVHPGCVMELETGEADSRPVVAAVDLAGCQRSNKYAVALTSERGRLRFVDKQLLGNGYFEYEDIGVTQRGTHVLRTYASGGGSGVFSSLISVRIEHDWAKARGKAARRTLLKSVGWLALPNDTGEIKLSGGQVTVGASKPLKVD